MALAERHRKALERKHPKYRVEIVKRQNASGKFSKNGKFFVFKLSKEKRLTHWLITPRVYSGRVVIRTLPDYEAHAATLQRAKALAEKLLEKDHAWALDKRRGVSMSAIRIGVSTRGSEFAEER